MRKKKRRLEEIAVLKMNNYSQIIPGYPKRIGWKLRKNSVGIFICKKIHIDLIDGKFAPNVTFLDPMPFTKYTKYQFSSHDGRRALNFKAIAAVGFRIYWAY